jgi:peptidoglycan/LPS O-acetylase OafA/YrhL
MIGLCLDEIGVQMFSHASVYWAPPGQSVIQHPVAHRLGIWILLENVSFLQTITGPEFGSNAALWSLANEFWYYIAFPLFAIVLRRESKGPARLACLISVAAVSWWVGLSISLYFSIWLLGVAAAYVPPVPKLYSRVLGSFATILFFAASMYLRRRPFGNHYSSDLILALIFAVLLYACLHEQHRVQAGFYARATRTLSNGSYTLYLVHVPALVFCNALILHVWHVWPKDALHFLAFGAVLITVLAYSYMIFLLFENQTDRVRQALSSHRRVSRTAA